MSKAPKFRIAAGVDLRPGDKVLMRGLPGWPEGVYRVGETLSDHDAAAEQRREHPRGEAKRDPVDAAADAGDARQHEKHEGQQEQDGRDGHGAASKPGTPATAPAVPSCPKCGRVAELVGGDAIYPNRPDLSAKRFWRCPNLPCDTWVGCHPNTTKPMGILADLELRQYKQMAHAVFDRQWRTAEARGSKTQGQARKKAYQQLARDLNIPSAECHIGIMDVDMCRRVIALCMKQEVGK